MRQRIDARLGAGSHQIATQIVYGLGKFGKLGFLTLFALMQYVRDRQHHARKALLHILERAVVDGNVHLG